MSVLRLFILFLFSTNLTAIKIPIPVTDLGKQITGDNNVIIKNDCYHIIDQILRQHNDVNIGATIMIAYYGIGNIPLSASLITESTHTTEWGRKYNRARKIKDLLIASSKSYAEGSNSEIISRKTAANRKNTYSKKQPLLQVFYRKLEEYKTCSRIKTRITLALAGHGKLPFKRK